MSSRHPAFSVISDMEEDVADVARWGQLIRILGASSSQIDPGVLHVIGRPLEELGERIDARWKEAFRIAGGQS